MAGLSVDQRNYYFLSEAERTGIHKPVLAALFAVHRHPQLKDGELGLGIAPAHRIPPEQVNTFPAQVQFAANTVRSITDKLTAQGWKGADFWDAESGRYSDRLIQAIAVGYSPPASDLAAARLETMDGQNLLQAYLEAVAIDHKADRVPPNLSYLDTALQRFLERVTRYYVGLSYQRTALVETVRLWRKLNTRQAAIASLLRLNETDPTLTSLDDATLDKALIPFIQPLSPFYAGYPHQREALIRLVQLWRQLESREATIATLEDDTSAETPVQLIDPALIAFAQSVPLSYQGRGEQRYALTEAYRFWHNLGSRTTALKELGIDAQVLTASNPNRTALVDTATQLDRALLEFIKRIPTDYQETDPQRQSLIRLVQLWQSLEGRDNTIQFLLDQMRRMEYARRGSADAFPQPEPAPLPPRPSQWTPNNLQLHASIIPNGTFTWAEATLGGTHLPSHPATIDAILRIAELAQQAHDRIGRLFRITAWYTPAESNPATIDTAQSRHCLGDAIEFYCDGLTGNQIYRALDSWWTGGLGRYTQHSALCYIDARRDRARWTR